MPRTIHTPKLAAVRFIGDFKKKLFEVGARKLPILERGDIVIVNEIEAMALKRQPCFEAVDIQTIFLGEESAEGDSTNSQDLKKGDSTNFIGSIVNKVSDIIKGEPNTAPPTEILPFIEDIDSLSEKEIKDLCDVLGIIKGHNKKETLKAMVLPYLKNKPN